MKGIELSFSNYYEVLKEVAKHHFIGKTMAGMQSMSAATLIYTMVTFALYLLQIYQNVTSCMRFYNNMHKMQAALFEIKQFVDYSIDSIGNFLNIVTKLPSYDKFSANAAVQFARLHELKKMLCNINASKISINNFNDIGYILQCFYELHDDPEIEDCLRYAMGFEGYINNIIGVRANMNSGNIAVAKFDDNANTNFKKQSYPMHINDDPVKNDCSFSKNMIISAPNKAGKTTFLKTTAINIIFSQQVGCGFFESAVLSPYEYIHSYINIPDTSGRDSLFEAESRQCKNIIDIIENNANSNHFCIFDELFSGTNPDQAGKSGYAFIEYLSKYKSVDFILTTHYKYICKKFRISDCVKNYKMDVKINDDETFKYTYKIKKGVSKIKGAIQVLKELNYPNEIIDNIKSL